VGVLQQGFLADVSGGDVFTYQHGKIAAGIGKNLGITDALQTFYGNWPSCADTSLDCLLFDYTVCVPCHRGASPHRKNVRAGNCF
jgi:hypothetical protein